MEIPEEILCLFSSELEDRDGSYEVEIPNRELQLGEIDEGEMYRVALLTRTTDNKIAQEESQSDSEPEPETSGPPVEEDETREVEIEDVGDKGDGITRVERGFVVIVPDTEQGERVTIKITNVRENVAFAEVLERQTHFH